LYVTTGIDFYVSQEGTLLSRVDVYLTAKVSLSQMVDSITSYSGRIVSHRVKFRIGEKIKSIDSGPSSSIVMEGGSAGKMEMSTEGSSSMDIDPSSSAW
jgi:hypothetical protein